MSSKPSNRFQSGTVIGTKQFKHSDAMLDTHITDVLQWWHGEREPRGVAVEDTSRCQCVRATHYPRLLNFLVVVLVNICQDVSGGRRKLQSIGTTK